MAQTKAQLLLEAKKLGLKVDPATKMADIRALIAQQSQSKTKEAPVDSNEAGPTKSDKEQPLAKAGKRSPKALKEAEEKVSKKTQPTRTGTVNKQNPPRPKLQRRSKNYRAAAAKLDNTKSYGLDEALKLAKATSSVKFDASIELHLNLAVDPRQADQNIRDNISLPAGTGKKIKIAALSDEPAVAQKAGADIAGGDDLISQIDKGQLDFDILIATPAYMPKLGKYARTLGPKGLMPNPKSGTVTNDIAKAISEAKAGRVEYRVDSTGIVHLAVGKVSFEEAGLLSNVKAVLTSIKANKPSSVKGAYLKQAYLSTSMGPSIKLDLDSINQA